MSIPTTIIQAFFSTGKELKWGLLPPPGQNRLFFEWRVTLYTIALIAVETLVSSSPNGGQVETKFPTKSWAVHTRSGRHI